MNNKNVIKNKKKGKSKRNKLIKNNNQNIENIISKNIKFNLKKIKKNNYQINKNIEESIKISNVKEEENNLKIDRPKNNNKKISFDNNCITNNIYNLAKNHLNKCKKLFDKISWINASYLSSFSKKEIEKINFSNILNIKNLKKNLDSIKNIKIDNLKINIGSNNKNIIKTNLNHKKENIEKNQNTNNIEKNQNINNIEKKENIDKIKKINEPNLKNDLIKNKDENIKNIDKESNPINKEIIIKNQNLNDDIIDLNKIDSKELNEINLNIDNSHSSIEENYIIKKTHFNQILFDSVYEYLVEEIINDILYIKLYLPSKYVKGIKTNLNYIKEYLNIICNMKSLNLEKITNKLNITLGFTKMEKLNFYNENIDENDLDDSNFSDCSKIKYEPILDMEIYNNHEKKHFNLENNEELLEYQIELYHIHNKMIFDSLNESLDYFRIYDLKGETLPYQLNKKYNKKIDIDKTKIILNKSTKKVLDWSNYLCGFIPFKNDSSLNLPIVWDEDTFNQIKEERLFKLVVEDIYEPNENWIQIEDDELEIYLEISNKIYNFLIKDTVKFFKKLNY